MTDVAVVKLDVANEVPECHLARQDEDEDAEANAVGEVTEGRDVVEQTRPSLPARLVPQDASRVDERADKHRGRDESWNDKRDDI